MVRLLTPDDVPAALELSMAAGWNQTAADWLRMIQLEPDACFGINQDERLIATATLLCFGTELAWIGMVLTHRDYQRRGLARRLMSAAVDTARARNVHCVKLDATDQGHAMYESFGFVDEQPVERWHRASRPHDPPIYATGEIPLPLDTEAFGTDRSRFVAALPPPVMVCGDGYAMRRPGNRASYIGPVVARDSHSAETLIGAAIDDGPWYWDILPDNRAARIIALELAFEPVRHLMRMRLGTRIRTRDDEVFGIAGFEAG